MDTNTPTYNTGPYGTCTLIKNAENAPTIQLTNEKGDIFEITIKQSKNKNIKETSEIIFQEMSALIQGTHGGAPINQERIKQIISKQAGVGPLKDIQVKKVSGPFFSKLSKIFGVHNEGLKPVDLLKEIQNAIQNNQNNDKKMKVLMKQFNQRFDPNKDSRDCATFLFTLNKEQHGHLLYYAGDAHCTSLIDLLREIELYKNKKHLWAKSVDFLEEESQHSAGEAGAYRDQERVSGSYSEYADRSSDNLEQIALLLDMCALANNPSSTDAEFQKILVGFKKFSELEMDKNEMQRTLEQGELSKEGVRRMKKHAYLFEEDFPQLQQSIEQFKKT